MHRSRFLLLTVGALFFTPGASQTPGLTFRDRIEAQRAIERVYYSHQIGASRSFEKAVPTSLLERKVRTYLEQSAALERFWDTPISAAALEAEWKRIAGSSRFPDRVEEIHAALGHDPVLIQETFVRSVLAERLSRSFFKTDERIHAQSRREIEALRERLKTGDLALTVEESRRTAWEVVRAGDEADRTLSAEAHDSDRDVVKMKVESEEFERWRASAPSKMGEIGEIKDEGDAWAVRVRVGEEDGSLRILRYAVPKVGWADWWRQTRKDWDAGSVATVAQPLQIVMPESGTLGFECDAVDTWDNGILDAAPRPASGHGAVWTGSMMLVWGGSMDETPTGLGSRYDPLTDTWSEISNNGALSLRWGSTAVWTGQEMIVWGGRGTTYQNTGGRYDPINDTWQATSTVGAPSGRSGHTAVWTGTHMVIYSGEAANGWPGNGGRYNPATDSWLPVPAFGLVAPVYHTAIWNGSRMIVWGGYALNNDPFHPTFVFINTGGLYDPVANTWSATTTVNAPSARRQHSAVWTGSRMIVWGGLAGSPSNTGKSYDPVANTWADISTLNGPVARYDHRAVWTGTRMIVWGGWGSTSSMVNSGGLYDPQSDSWSGTSMGNAPSARAGHSAIWTGDRMIVWGGNSNTQLFALDTGGRYDPATNTWTPTSTTGGPTPRYHHTAVWTGSEMIIWGGNASAPTNTGGRYDAVSDSWTPTTITGAPEARYGHVAIWSGDEMVVWGGLAGGLSPQSGGRYDPILDTWSETTLVDSPPGRYKPTAVWTGAEMIVWGGGNPPVGTGGRYNPTTDTWIATSPGPLARLFHSAVWTGSRMIVWGGWSSDYQNTGAVYDPGSDTWTPTSVVNAPAGRELHTAVWSGSRMIVWGGVAVPTSFNTGGRYDPATDTWSPMSTGPSARQSHTAVWAGNRMVIFGGTTGGDWFSSGGRYDSVNDTWEATAVLGTPGAFSSHTAISTGHIMMVWGGYITHGAPIPTQSSGGRYVPSGFDLDQDGYYLCAGDCDDFNAAVHPGVLEACDGVDNDCDGSIDEPFDTDGDGFATCAGDCNDSNPSINPGVPEVCNNDVDDDCDLIVDEAVVEVCDHLDNDCDSLIDEGFDQDSDGFTTCQGDCNDVNPNTSPGAAEACNGIDDDCDGAVDEGPDADGDGSNVCADCDDSVASVHPGAVEVCDGIDQNCDGVRDDGFPDGDGDGFAACMDCVDSDPAVNPGANEACNYVDDNCNGLMDEGFDMDGDGVRTCDADCDDADPDTWQMPIEVWDLTLNSVMPADLSWVDLSPYLGPSIVYDLVSGPLLSVAGLNLPSATCLQSGGPNSYQDSRPNPSPGSGVWYLARAHNSCGAGTYGFSSGGLERTTPACP